MSDVLEKLKNSGGLLDKEQADEFIKTLLEPSPEMHFFRLGDSNAVAAFFDKNGNAISKEEDIPKELLEDLLG
jgi:hypothetical protein